MILTDVTKLKTSELAAEVTKALKSGGKRTTDWGRIYECLKEIEERALSAEKMAEVSHG